ncbi:MAG TPA: oligosaccharide flippase family protein, partial [Chloroflexota bacterium]
MLRNVGFLLVTEVVTRLAALALAVAIARGVGSAEYGHYTYALAFAGTFAAFADFGISRLLTRSVAAQRGEAARLISASLAARATMLLPALGGALLLIHWQPADQQPLLVLLVAVAATQSVAGLARSVFYGFERMQLDTASRLLERLLALSGAFLALENGLGLVGVAIAFLVAGVVDVVVVSVMVVSRLACPARSSSVPVVRTLLHDALPVGLYGLVLAVQTSAPLYFLSALRGASSTGQYSAAATPIFALIPLPVLAAGAAFP